ncbi:Gamma-glutamyltranspeptidase [Trinorchestia longiramus]|nr:Gamma-glutamyltranspeptidase [Trinorchestia longiramus]
MQENSSNSSSLAVLRDLMDGVDAAALRRLPQHAATQVSAIDTYDLYVTAVAGIGSLFGSQLMTTHGVLFNNMLASVPLSASSSTNTTQDGSYNSGRGRPLVPYAPFIVVDDLKVCGRRVVCSSSSVSDSVQVLTHYLLRQLPLTSAVAQPRVALDPSNDLVLLDDLSDGLRLPGSVRNFLISHGYQLGMNRPPYSSVNSVAKQKDDMSSHSDPRGGGLAARLGSGGIDYQKESSLSDISVEKATGASVHGDVHEADALAVVAALNNSNSDTEFFDDVGGSDNIADEGSAHAVLQYTQEGGKIYENAPTSPDYTTDILKKKVKESSTERSNTVNKKYIGDAGAFEKSENPSQGTGRVVKGDARGGVRFVYHELEENLKGTSSDDNRSNNSFGIVRPGQSKLQSTEPAELPLPTAPRTPPVDSVFSDYDPLRHMSQVRVDGYQTGEEERFIGPDADYVEAPINIWGNPETRLVSAPAHVAVLPGHLAYQFKKQIQKQQLAEQRRQKLESHFQQQQPSQALSQFPVVFGPDQPGSGLPVIVQRHRDHSHPILGSEVSGPYEEISG